MGDHSTAMGLRAHEQCRTVSPLPQQSNAISHCFENVRRIDCKRFCTAPHDNIELRVRFVERNEGRRVRANNFELELREEIWSICRVEIPEMASEMSD